MARSAFEELEILFPRQKTINPIEAFLRQYQGKDLSGRKRKQKLVIRFGQEYLEKDIEVLPLKEARVFRGSEFGESIVKIYNKDYWLVALWTQMAKNAEHSYLGRELVRAFVKHGIFLTGEELLRQGRVIDAQFLRENGLANRVNFYRAAFNWAGIFKCVRARARRKVSQRLKEDTSGAKGHSIGRLNWESVSNSIPEVNKVLAYSNLPQIAVDAREKSENIGGILRWIYINSLFLQDSRRLRKHLEGFLRGAS